MPEGLLVRQIKRLADLQGQMKSRKNRLQVFLSDDELAAVENFRFAHRMPSRAAAFRELLKRAFAVHEKAKNKDE